MKFLNTDAIHESGTLLYNKPVKENFKITTAPCPVFKDDTYIEFTNYAKYEEKLNFNFQKVEFYYEPSTDIETITDTDYPDDSDFNTEDGIVVKVYKLIGIIGTNLFGEQHTKSNISQLCLYRAFEITNADATLDKDKYKDGITYYLYSYYSKGNLDYSKRYYLGKDIPSGKYEVSYSSLTLNDKAIKGEAVKVDPEDIEYPTDNKGENLLYPVFGHNRICASGKYYELKIYESDNECPIYLPMQEGTVDGESNNLVVNVNYSGMVTASTTEYYHTINNLDSWSTQLYCMYNTIHGYTTDITNNANLETIKYFPVTNNESINGFKLGGVKHKALKTGINNFENIVSVPNISDGYKVSKNDYVEVMEPAINSSVTLNKNELYKFTATLTINDDKLIAELDGNNIFDIKFVLKLSYTNNKDIVKLIEFNNNYVTSNDAENQYTINIEKYFTAPISQATTSAKLVCSDIEYKYMDVSDTTKPVKTGTTSLNNGFAITDIKLYQLTPKNPTLAGTFYTKYAYNTDNTNNTTTYIGQDTFTLYDNDIQDSEVYREWYYYLNGTKFENNYTNIKITPLDTNGTLTCTVEPTDGWTDDKTTAEEILTNNTYKKTCTFTAKAKFTDERIKIFTYTWKSDNTNLVNISTNPNKANESIEITRNLHNETHLVGGTIEISCTAKIPDNIYGFTKSADSTREITWVKVPSSIIITSDSGNQITNGATLYLGQTYTNRYTIKSIYPIKSVSETNSTSRQITNNWNTDNTYTYELTFTPTLDNITTSTKYNYTVTATDNQDWTSPPLSFSDITITVNLIVKTEVEETPYNLTKTDDKIIDQDGNEVSNISLRFEAEFDPSLDTDEATITYQWQESTDKSTWKNIQYATSSSYTINYSNNSSIGTTYYRCEASSTYANRSLLSKIATVIIHEININTEVTTVGFGEPGMKYYIVPTTNIIYRNYNDIQTAIDNAADYATTNNPTEVWIAKGTYKHGSEMTMKNNVAIYGGFAGTETSKDQRVAGNNTILDGEGKYRVFNNKYTSSNPLANSAKLDNVTIQNGYVDSNDFPNGYYGAGMYNVYASPEITNCTFSGNSANYGGGMYNEYSSSPVLTNCTFTNNSADYGGGMYNDRSSDPVLTNCTFSNNSASSRGSFGGGMYNSSSSPELINCTFSGNSAGWLGGGMYNDEGSPVLTNCTFTNNSADYGGGVMFASSRNLLSSPVLTNCTFSGNSANYGGGAMHNYDSSPKLTNCTFSNNSASSGGDGTLGGGGGAILILNTSTLILTDCKFEYNTAVNFGGGAIANIANHPGSSLQLNYCTFNGNTAKHGGGAIENQAEYLSTPTTLTANYCYFVENKTTGTIETGDRPFGGAIVSRGRGTINNITGCTFNGNEAMSGGAIYSSDNTNDVPTSDEYSKTKLTNCTFYGNKSTRWSGGAVENAESKLEAYYCTFTENICGPDGVGAAIYDNEQEESTVLTNCILWNNKKVSESSYSHGYNTSNANVNKINRTYCVIQNSSNPSPDIKTTDPKLQSLTDNEGFVPTIAVVAGSSAIGAGIVIDDITTDARGYIRSTTAPTIGAYEYNGTPPS